MSSELDNQHQPAYPSYEHRRVGEVERTDIVNTGLTKRELLAAMAMQGLMSNHTTLRASSNALAVAAVESADALLKELAK